MLPALSCALCLLAPPHLPGLPEVHPVSLQASDDLAGPRSAALLGLGVGCAGVAAVGGLAAGVVIGGTLVVGWLVYEFFQFVSHSNLAVGPTPPRLGLALSLPLPGAR